MEDESDYEKNERLKAMMMADLGIARREIISANDNVVANVSSVVELEARRASNIRGSQANIRADKDRKLLDGWNALHKTVGDVSSTDRQLDDLMRGQSHRAALNASMEQLRRTTNPMESHGPNPFPRQAYGGGGLQLGKRPRDDERIPMRLNPHANQINSFKQAATGAGFRLDPALDSNNGGFSVSPSSSRRGSRGAGRRRGSGNDNGLGSSSFHGRGGLSPLGPAPKPAFNPFKPGKPIAGLSSKGRPPIMAGKLASPQDFLTDARNLPCKPSPPDKASSSPISPSEASSPTHTPVFKKTPIPSPKVPASAIAQAQAQVQTHLQNDNKLGSEKKMSDSEKVPSTKVQSSATTHTKGVAQKDTKPAVEKKEPAAKETAGPLPKFEFSPLAYAPEQKAKKPSAENKKPGAEAGSHPVFAFSAAPARAETKSQAQENVKRRDGNSAESPVTLGASTFPKKLPAKPTKSALFASKHAPKSTETILRFQIPEETSRDKKIGRSLVTTENKTPANLPSSSSATNWNISVPHHRTQSLPVMSTSPEDSFTTYALTPTQPKEMDLQSSAAVKPSLGSANPQQAPQPDLGRPSSSTASEEHTFERNQSLDSKLDVPIGHLIDTVCEKGIAKSPTESPEISLASKGAAQLEGITFSTEPDNVSSEAGLPLGSSQPNPLNLDHLSHLKQHNEELPLRSAPSNPTTLQPSSDLEQQNDEADTRPPVQDKMEIQQQISRIRQQLDALEKFAEQALRETRAPVDAKASTEARVPTEASSLTLVQESSVNSEEQSTSTQGSTNVEVPKLPDQQVSGSRGMTTDDVAVLPRAENTTPPREQTKPLATPLTPTHKEPPNSFLAYRSPKRECFSDSTTPSSSGSQGIGKEKFYDARDSSQSPDRDDAGKNQSPLGERPVGTPAKFEFRKASLKIADRPTSSPSTTITATQKIDENQPIDSSSTVRDASTTQKIVEEQIIVSRSANTTTQKTQKTTDDQLVDTRETTTTARNKKTDVEKTMEMGKSIHADPQLNTTQKTQKKTDYQLIDKRETPAIAPKKKSDVEKTMEMGKSKYADRQLITSKLAEVKATKPAQMKTEEPGQAALSHLPKPKENVKPNTKRQTDTANENEAPKPVETHAEVGVRVREFGRVPRGPLALPFTPSKPPRATQQADTPLNDRHDALQYQEPHSQTLPSNPIVSHGRHRADTLPQRHTDENLPSRSSMPGHRKNNEPKSKVTFIGPKPYMGPRK